MIEMLHAMVAEMRRMRIPVATSDVVSATRALGVADLGDREALRESLACCLAKSLEHRQAFDLIFQLWFADSGQPGRSLRDLSADALREVLLDALADRNRTLLRQIAAESVDRYAQIVPGRAVAGTYYIFRTMQGLGVDSLEEDLEALGRADADGAAGVIARATREQRATQAVTELERIVESEVRSRLVADRGPDAVAATLRSPLPEDIDFLTASAATIDRMSEIVQPLGTKLGRLLTAKQRAGAHRRIDIRATIRQSLSTGGAPVTLRYLPPQPPKPRLVVLADISGSVASFAAFALQLTHALRGRFASLRSFVFVDAAHEVSDLVGATRAIVDTTHHINTERRGIRFDGHSDYGSAFVTFTDDYPGAVDARTTVLVLGDARTNYRDPRTDSLRAIRERAANLYWLNPERTARWDDGDSAMSLYAEHCDTAVECRTVRQLEAFVTGLG